MKSLLKHGNTSGSAPLEVIDMKIVDNQNMQDQVIKGVYDNPDVALCRELICNMSDSHLAAGNPDRAPVVTLASKMEPYLTFRDFGKGMTHEEIKQVYSQIGMSDKRESGVQTGEKGLGAKSPLAYRDSFSLTCYDEDGYRAYSVCYSEERRAQVLLLAQGPNNGSKDPETGLEYPNEERGVEIVIAVKDGDIEAMNSNVLNTISNFAHPYSNDVAKPVVAGMELHTRRHHEEKVLGTAVNPSQKDNSVGLTSLVDSWSDAQMVTDFAGYVGQFNAASNRNHYRYRGNKEAAAWFYNANVRYEVSDLRKLLKDDKEIEYFEETYPLAMQQDTLLFFVPLLNPEDKLPYIATTAGRDTIQPHPRTTAWLKEVMKDFEAKLCRHIADRMIETNTYFEAFDLVQKENLYFSANLSAKINQMLCEVKGRLFPEFRQQSYVWRGEDTYLPLQQMRSALVEAITSALQPGTDQDPALAAALTKEVWAQLSWSRLSGNKAFTRNATQKDFCQNMRDSGKLLVVDDHRSWKARVQASRLWLSRDHAVSFTPPKDSWMAVRGSNAAHCEDKADNTRFKKAIKDVLAQFGITPLFVSELPKYTPTRVVTRKGSAASKAATQEASTPALRKHERYAHRAAERFKELVDWDKAPQHVKDGKFIYVKLKANDMVLDGKVLGAQDSISELTLPTWSGAILSSLGVVPQKGEKVECPIYFIRETEMPKTGMPDSAIEFTEWIGKEVLFMKPAMERYEMARALESMIDDCDVGMKTVSDKPNHYLLHSNDMGFKAAPQLRASLRLLLERKEVTKTMLYARNLYDAMQLSVLAECKNLKAANAVISEISNKRNLSKKGSYYEQYTPVFTALFEAMPALPVIAKMEDATRHVFGVKRLDFLGSYKLTVDEAAHKNALNKVMKARPWLKGSYCESHCQSVYWGSQQNKLVQSILDCSTQGSSDFTKTFPKLPRTKSRPGLEY